MIASRDGTCNIQINLSLDFDAISFRVCKGARFEERNKIMQI